jgi:hypothetical protein
MSSLQIIFWKLFSLGKHMKGAGIRKQEKKGQRKKMLVNRGWNKKLKIELCFSTMIENFHLFHTLPI